MLTVSQNLQLLIKAIISKASALNFNAQDIALLAKALLAAEKFPTLIDWAEPLYIYIQNDHEEITVHRKLTFNEEGLILNTEGVIKQSHGSDSFFNMDFEFSTYQDPDEIDEQMVQDVETWCAIALTELETGTVEIIFYEYLDWPPFNPYEPVDSKATGEESEESGSVPSINPTNVSSSSHVQATIEFPEEPPNLPNHTAEALEFERIAKDMYRDFLYLDNIKIGRALIPIDTVVSICIVTKLRNPDEPNTSIVYRIVDYLQS
jgi:hypothetical protein